MDDLDRRVDDCDPVALDAPHDGDAPPTDFCVQEGIADVDRDLVAELGAPIGVADDQDVRHGDEPTLPEGRVAPVGSALQELRARLAEVSDLSRAAGVLGWDQRVTMPPRGTEARAEQLSTLGRIVHERFTDDEVGRLLDRAEPLVEAQPYDSDDRSLVRVTRRDWEKARRVPTELRAEMTLAGRARAPRLGRGAPDQRLRLVPAVPADERRAEAPLRRVLRVVGQPVHAAARRLRAWHADDRGARGVRRRCAPR